MNGSCSDLSIDDKLKDDIDKDDNAHSDASSVTGANVGKRKLGRPPKRFQSSIKSSTEKPTKDERLERNRKSAKMTRNKRKCYVKALETRVTILEQQNQILIEKLKILKQNYLSLRAEIKKDNL